MMIAIHFIIREASKRLTTITKIGTQCAQELLLGLSLKMFATKNVAGLLDIGF